MSLRLETTRTVLRPWSKAHRVGFAAMHADPEVMHDYGGPQSRTQSDAKLARYISAFEKLGFTRWAIEDTRGQFLGYTGVLPIPADYPLQPGFQIGWRMVRRAWGQGLATEASAAALADAFQRCNLEEVVSYTSAENLRSVAVMHKLGLERAPARDFVIDRKIGPWQGLVWIAHRNRWTAPSGR